MMQRYGMLIGIGPKRSMSTISFTLASFLFKLSAGS
jgi:hypothetical protein